MVWSRPRTYAPPRSLDDLRVHRGDVYAVLRPTALAEDGDGDSVDRLGRRDPRCRYEAHRAARAAMAVRARVYRRGLGCHLRVAGDSSSRWRHPACVDCRWWLGLHGRCGMLCDAMAESVAEDIRPPRVLPCLHIGRCAVSLHRDLLRALPLTTDISAECTSFRT